MSVLLHVCLQTTLLGELRQLGAAISQDIYQESPNVKWSDIAGLTDAKRFELPPQPPQSTMRSLSLTTRAAAPQTAGPAVRSMQRAKAVQPRLSADLQGGWVLRLEASVMVAAWCRRHWFSIATQCLPCCAVCCCAVLSGCCRSLLGYPCGTLSCSLACWHLGGVCCCTDHQGQVRHSQACPGWLTSVQPASCVCSTCLVACVQLVWASHAVHALGCHTQYIIGVTDCN